MGMVGVLAAITGFTPPGAVGPSSHGTGDASR